MNYGQAEVAARSFLWCSGAIAEDPALMESTLPALEC